MGHGGTERLDHGTPLQFEGLGLGLLLEFSRYHLNFHRKIISRESTAWNWATKEKKIKIKNKKKSPVLLLKIFPPLNGS